MKQNKTLTLIPVMLAFFAMGFVDLVGIASNFVKNDLQLSDSVANILPSLVFFWFLIFSVPTGVLMNKIGRKKTVMLSLLVTLISLAMPIFGNSFAVMLLSFSLLGIGNAIMQTSLNPLIAAITGGRNLASTLTFGQFVKAIASFSAPYLATWGATKAIPDFGLDWRVLFLIFLLVGTIATLWLGLTPIEEVKNEDQEETVSVGRQFAGSVKLLAKPIVLLSFIAIMCHVGTDVGINTTAPKILMERLGIDLNAAAFATSLYFIFRTVGCLTGSFFLRIMKTRTFYIASIVMIALGILLLFYETNQWMLYAAIALVGFGNSNVFSMIMSQALLSVPEKQNEVSGLMIMGLFGGTVFPLLMGICSDAVGRQAGAVFVLAIATLYLIFYTKNVKK